MRLAEQKWIETPHKLIGFKELKETVVPQTTRIYSQTVNDSTKQFVHKDNIEWLDAEKAYADEAIVKILKEQINCLAPHDNILFFDKDKLLCSMPFKCVFLYPMIDGLDKIINNSLNKSAGEVFFSLVCYDVTKDLKYLNMLTESYIPLSVFAMLEAANGLDDYEKIMTFLETNGADAPAYNTPLREGELAIKTMHDQNIQAAANTVRREKKRKNLVILHLESISNEIYYNHRDKLENLTALFNRSIDFCRFYTSASSSIMSLLDLFYGNDFETDKCVDFEELYPIDTYTTHLFQILKNNGYETMGAGFNEHPWHDETNGSNVWNVEGEKYLWFDNFHDLLDGSEEFIIKNKENGKPFAIHIWDLLTQSGHFDDETKNAGVYDRKLCLSMVSVDIMVKRIMDCLNNNGLMDDTVIVCYGDHGDDLWTREINSGFSHITPPHFNLIWTPAAIYDSRIKPFLFNNLASMIDLKNTILFMLGIENPDDFPHQGINLFTEKNEFVYSRSLFFNQREQERINSCDMIRLNNYKNLEAKNKAFGIITEKYNLIAGKDGLELYLYLTDPGNYNNLLNFIDFDGDFSPRRMLNHGAWRGTFRKILMKDEQAYEVLYYFNMLKKKLLEYMKIKAGFVDREEKNLFDLARFKKVRGRGFFY